MNKNVNSLAINSSIFAYSFESTLADPKRDYRTVIEHRPGGKCTIYQIDSTSSGILIYNIALQYFLVSHLHKPNQHKPNLDLALRGFFICPNRVIRREREIVSQGVVNYLPKRQYLLVSNVTFLCFRCRVMFA